MARKHSANATLWANKICAGEREFEETPARLKEEVKKILIERGFLKEETTETDNPTTEESGNTSTDETSKSE